MNTNEENKLTTEEAENIAYFKPIIKAVERAELAFRCFNDEIRMLENEMNNFDNEDKLKIESVIKKADEFVEDWRIFYGVFLEDLSAYDELYDEKGVLKV